MSREIKFRAWDGKEMRTAFDLTQNPKFWWVGNKDYPLMQYTGLKDKNGVEIYEGDVVEASESVRQLYSNLQPYMRCSVVYWDGAFRLFYEHKNIETIDRTNIDIEVIGNAYEHPELIQSTETYGPRT